MSAQDVAEFAAEVRIAAARAIYDLAWRVGTAVYPYTLSVHVPRSYAHGGVLPEPVCTCSARHFSGPVAHVPHCPLFPSITNREKE